MFTTPTVDDALDSIRTLLDKVLDGARLSVNRIKAACTAKGLYNSGATIKRVLEEAHQAFEGGVHSALGELARVIRITKFDPSNLRQLTARLLGQFAIGMKQIADADARA